MKPVVILALSKELQGYVRSIQHVEREHLMEINKRLLKMQLEVFETLEKFS
ncbi:MAG TPA: hypothetical protein PKM65_19565 [Spirochaetota bacterium]|nr:hypothetical protein [Spirochaetota bacterium]HNT12971.1 hypothetical protein [Spirochaetota bacterium]